MVLTIAMVSYFAMATGLGISYIPTKVDGANPENLHLFRQVYYARKWTSTTSSVSRCWQAGYIDWLFTTPLLLVSLGVLAGLSPASTLLAIFADIFMVVTGLLAGVKGSAYYEGERYKWAWYTLSCIAFVAIFYILLIGGQNGEYTTLWTKDGTDDSYQV
jgi:bacteriorhodopsin